MALVKHWREQGIIKDSSLLGFVIYLRNVLIKQNKLNLTCTLTYFAVRWIDYKQ